MADLKAKRKLSNITFEEEGCHVALVAGFQGGAANGFTTLLTKATADVSEEELQNALDNTTPIDKSNEEETSMSTMTEAQVQEILKSALEKQAKENKDAIEKAREDAKSELQAEIQKQAGEMAVLKAAEEARIDAKFEAIAKSHADTLGEDFKVEDLAKSLKEASSSESTDYLLKALEAYARIVKNADLLVEKGVSNTKPQDKKAESKLDVEIRKYRDENKVSEAVATAELAKSHPELFEDEYQA